jgi:hypothetical protein
VRELEKKEQEKHAREEVESEEERHRCVGIEDA